MKTGIDVSFRIIGSILAFAAAACAFAAAGPLLAAERGFEAWALCLPAIVLTIGALTIVLALGDDRWLASLGAGGVMFAALLVFHFGPADLRDGSNLFPGRPIGEIALLTIAFAATLTSLFVEAFLAGPFRERGVAAVVERTTR